MILWLKTYRCSPKLTGGLKVGLINFGGQSSGSECLSSWWQLPWYLKSTVLLIVHIDNHIPSPSVSSIEFLFWDPQMFHMIPLGAKKTVRML